jgi:hypothetical protein
MQYVASPSTETSVHDTIDEVVGEGVTSVTVDGAGVGISDFPVVFVGEGVGATV